jgi:hypothetical protein
MILYNKTILLSNLQSLYQLLQNNDNESLSTCKYIYDDRIAVKHYTHKELNIIQIWKTKSLLDWWYDSYCSKNFMATIDYTLYDTYIKIEHVGINDYDRRNRYSNYNCLDEYDAEDLIKNMVDFVKLIGIKEKKEKIILDVHENLRLYLKYYYYIGFKTTERKCIDNPFWIETELIIGG